MNKIKRLILLIIVFIIVVLLKGNIVFAESTIQVVPTKNDDKNSTVSAWTDISVSNAYEICQNLNKNYSTLGTDKLKAHLTTNADWYAVSLLAYSAYGNRDASNTTGNKTGIMRLGTLDTFTASLMGEASSNINIKSLYDNLALKSPYVEKVETYTNRLQNSKGMGLLESEYFVTNKGGYLYADSVSLPVCTRHNLFGITLGKGSWQYGGYDHSNGSPKTEVTFRPVIWNK